MAQEKTKKVPTVKIKNINGQQFNTADIQNDGKPMIISFWATWCKPCIKELKAIDESFEDWVDETGVKLYAVSIDDKKTSARVKTMTNAFGWEYEILMDENQDFKRALNVGNVPHTFLIDGKGNIVWQHTSYAPGDEEELYEELLKLVK